MERDNFMDPYQAKEFGLLDHVVESRKAKKRSKLQMTTKDTTNGALRCSFCGKDQKKLRN